MAARGLPVEVRGLTKLFGAVHAMLGYAAVFALVGLQLSVRRDVT